VRKSKRIDAFKCEYAVNVGQKLALSFNPWSRANKYSWKMFGESAGTCVEVIPQFRVRSNSTVVPNTI